MTFHAYLQYVCLLLVCLCTLPSPMEARVQADRQSTGTRDTLLVIDQESGLPIEGAYILTRERLLVSSPRGMIVFGHGTCFMDTVLVQCLGYGSRRVPLNEVFKESSIHTVCLSPDIQKLGEVVVTGERAGASPNVVSRRLSSPEIRNALGTSLATLLERVSGVSSISTGTTVSKPVIQGMYGNRILIIHNGARQTGQQWGADHAPEVDMNGSSSVSVIKGSDAVRYGSDALGGIIVMEQSPLPFRKRSLQGGISALYGSNGRRYVATGQLEGAFPGDFAWRLQGTWSNSGDRSTAHYLLNNTGTREYHASASLGYDRGRLRVEGFYSRFYSRTGVMLSAQMGSEDLLAERIRLGRPLHTDPFSRGIRAPCQEVTHQITFGRMRLGMKKGGSIHWQSTWQKDDRQENRVRRLDSNIPAVSLHLNSFQHLLRWKRDYRSWQVEAGGQVMFIENHSRAGTGFVPVIPNYTETQAGIYGIGKYHLARGEALKQASAWICRKPVPVVMTGREAPMAGQEILTTCPTAWEDTINFPDAGGSPPTSVWLGVPLTCMNCTATGTSSGLGCLSGETLRCTRKEATNGYLPSVTATGCSASVWTVTCNGWTAISMTGRRKRQSP